MRVGVDVGGTKCLAVALDDDGTVIESIKEPTPGSVSGLLDAIAGLAARFGDPWTLGVGVAGLVTRDGIVRTSPNVPALVEVPVRTELEARLGRSVHVDNDATCATVAEWRLGAARGHDDAVLVTFGTGIGAGVVMGGHLQRGANGFAGEPGHMVVDPGGPVCVCGQRGCWERYASGAGLQRLAGELMGERLTGEEVVARAADGEHGALRVVNEVARWAAIGLVNLTNVLDPSALVVGGGLVEMGDLLLSPIRRWYGELLYAPDHRSAPDIVAAQLGERAGAVGAALLGADVRAR